jgi:uncharacterized protein (DUF58 family)
MPEGRQGGFPWLVAWVLLGLALLAREPVLLLAAAIVIVAGVTSELTARLAHEALRVRVGLSESHLIAGEDFVVTLDVENAKSMALTWCELRLDLPEGIEMTGREPARARAAPVAAFAPRANERIRLRFALRAVQRGAYAIGAARVRTGDWLGFFTEERDAGELRPLVAYPRALPVRMVDVPALRPLAERSARRGLLPDPLRFAGVRDHRPHDARRDIHWKATARLGRLQTRVFEPATSGDVILLVNVASYPSYWIQADPDAVEDVVSASTAVLQQSATEGRRFGLVTNGIDGLTHQRPRALLGRGPAKLRRALELVARLSPYAAGTPETIFLREHARMAWGATLVCITPALFSGLTEALIRFRRMHHRVLVMCVARIDPVLLARCSANGVAVQAIGERRVAV